MKGGEPKYVEPFYKGFWVACLHHLSTLLWVIGEIWILCHIYHLSTMSESDLYPLFYSHIYIYMDHA